MRQSKRKRLEVAGWKLGSAQDFLSLSDEEAAVIEVRIALARILRDLRAKRRLTQNQLATAIKSSQSRVAKMEAADHSVSIDLLIRTLISSGVSGSSIGEAFSSIP